MHVFHFGDSQKRLFGVYDGPPGPGRTGAVLCPPLGHEYIRSYRTMRTLAGRLTQAGLHVLRFDYYATGDSAGNSEEGSLEQWRTDIGTAIDELKDMAGVGRVSLLGVRFGATLAALAASSRRDIDTLVLWDPVPQGRTYVADLQRMQDQWIKARPWLNLSSAEHDEMIGFPLTSEMRAAFEATDLASLTAWPARKIVLLSSSDAPGQLAEQIARTHSGVTAQQVACDCQWDRPEAVHLALLASEMVQSISSVFDNRVVA